MSRYSLQFPEEFDSDDDGFDEFDAMALLAEMGASQPSIHDFAISDALMHAYDAVVRDGEGITELLVTAQSKWRAFEREFLLNMSLKETDDLELLWISTFFNECRHQARGKDAAH